MRNLFLSEKCSSFKLNKLEVALGSLEILRQHGKKFKTKSQKAFWVNSYVFRS